MALTDHVAALAARVGEEIKAVRALLPSLTGHAVYVGDGAGTQVMARQLAMAWWRQAFGRRWYFPVSIMPMGSSTTEGFGASTIPERWIERVVDALQDRHNPPGVGGGRCYLPHESGTKTGTTSVASEGQGLRTLNMNAGATLTLTVADCTGFDVLYRQGPGSGSFTVKVGAAAAVTVTPNTGGASGRHDGVYSSPTVARGTQTLVITATNACSINAIYARDGDETTGVRLYNSGKGGTLSADFVNTPSLYTRVGQIGPSLIPIMMGANDYDLDVPLSTFKANLESIISQCKNALAAAGKGPATYLLLGTYRRFDPNVAVTAHPWSGYLGVMSEVADADAGNVAYIDLSVPWPQSQAGDPYDVIWGDDLHLSTYGHGMMADLVLDALEATPQIVVGAVDRQPTDRGQVRRRSGTNQALASGNNALNFGTETDTTVHASSATQTITIGTSGMWLLDAAFAVNSSVQVMIWIAYTSSSTGTRIAQTGAFTSQNGNISAVTALYLPAGTVLAVGCWVSAAATAIAGEFTHFSATLLRTE